MIFEYLLFFAFYLKKCQNFAMHEKQDFCTMANLQGMLTKNPKDKLNLILWTTSHPNFNNLNLIVSFGESFQPFSLILTSYCEHMCNIYVSFNFNTKVNVGWLSSNLPFGLLGCLISPLSSFPAQTLTLNSEF